jgi:GTP-binding protein EngB required for normal cell division
MSYQAGFATGQNGYYSNSYRATVPPASAIPDDRHFENGSQDPLLEVVESIEFGNEEREIMDEIDKLREAGVDQLVELPQIIVVGDQSAGKSSVLEALTEVYFPRASTKCTKFATQIKLRHSNDSSFSANIIPDSSSTPVEKQRLAQFPQSFEKETPFREIIVLATNTICPPDNPRFWSKHILSLEVSGPNLPHLTIVDLPGFIHAASGPDGQGSVDAIMETAFHYMANQRSIILAVVSAATDPELQTVLGAKARRFDPSGERTIGVITKPDESQPKAREDEFIALARNQAPGSKLKLGWHVVRNRTHQENTTGISTQERNEREMAFLLGHPSWSKLGQENLGISSLKAKLSAQLVKHISKEMPMVHAEILTKLEECKMRLSKLGKRRDTVEDMRDELLTMLEESQKLAKTAIDGQYIDPHGSIFFDLKSRKLRARIVLANEAFSKSMLEWGHTVELVDDRDRTQRRHGQSDQSLSQQIMTRSKYIEKVVGPLLEESPGLELSMDRNPLPVFTMFRSYSENWPSITSTYIREVYGICVEFLNEVINFVWPDDMKGRVWTQFVAGDIEGRLTRAEAETAKLFKDRTRIAKTYDPDHEKRVNEWLTSRQFAANPDGSPRPAMPLVTNAELFLQKMLVFYDVSLASRLIEFSYCSI